MFTAFPIEAKPAAFSWSEMRKRRFSFCKRAYFYHYYAAQGGFEKYSEARLLYRLKHLQYLSSWHIAILREALRTWFYNLESGVGQGDNRLYRIMRKIFKRNVRSLKQQEWHEDCKKLNLFELYYETVELDEVLESTIIWLREALEELRKSELWQILGKIDSLNRVFKTVPLAANFNALQLWFSPDLIWREQGKFYFLHLVCHDIKQSDTKTVLEKLYALQKFKASPLAVEHLLYQLNTGELIIQDTANLNSSQVLNDITKSCAEMLVFTEGKTKIIEDNFQKNLANCKKCRFEEFCNKRP